MKWDGEYITNEYEIKPVCKKCKQRRISIEIEYQKMLKVEARNKEKAFSLKITTSHLRKKIHQLVVIQYLKHNLLFCKECLISVKVKK